MNLLKLRKEKNKSQQEIAELLGIRQTAYSKYENNLTEPSIENLIKLADYYQVSIDYLVDRKYINEIGYLTPQQMECVQILKRLNETNLIKLMGYLSAMISMQ